MNMLPQLRQHHRHRPFDTTGWPTGEPVKTSSHHRSLSPRRLQEPLPQDRVGIDARLYGIQFVRDIDAVIVPGSTLLPSGLNIETPLVSYRAGFRYRRRCGAAAAQPAAVGRRRVL